MNLHLVIHSICQQKWRSYEKIGHLFRNSWLFLNEQMISIQDASITCISCRGDSPKHVSAIFKECCVIIIKKKLERGAFSTGGYWPLQFLSCLPLFLLLLHFFCLSTAKCSWSHTKENEGHKRKEMKLDISGLHIGQGLVILVLYVLFSHFLFSSRIECKIFHQVPYTNTYL